MRKKAYVLQMINYRDRTVFVIFVHQRLQRWRWSNGHHTAAAAVRTRLRLSLQFCFLGSPHLDVIALHVLHQLRPGVLIALAHLALIPVPARVLFHVRSQRIARLERFRAFGALMRSQSLHKRVLLLDVRPQRPLFDETERTLTASIRSFVGVRTSMMNAQRERARI